MLVPPSRACPRSWFALPFLLLPLGTAQAGPEPPALDLAQLQDDMRQAPPGSDGVTAPTDPQAQPGHVIYLNYEGGTISSGGGYESDSKSNTSWVCQGTFTPFGAGQMQDASI